MNPWKPIATCSSEEPTAVPLLMYDRYDMHQRCAPCKNDCLALDMDTICQTCLGQFSRILSIQTFVFFLIKFRLNVPTCLCHCSVLS